MFGETDNTIDVKYAGFNHDVISSETMTKQRLDYDIATGWRWQDGSSLFQGEIFPIKIKGVASNLSGYSLQVSGIAETIKKDFYWGNRLHDEATITHTSDVDPLDGTGYTKVYILNFLTS